MAKRKQEIVLENFSFTIGKLVVKADAEGPDTVDIGNQLGRIIGQVLPNPHALLNPPDDAVDEPKSPQKTLFDEPAPPKKRRRRRTATANAASDTANDDEATRKPRARSGTSVRGLIEELAHRGFFAQERTIGDIREELSNGGHSFSSNHLSPVLIALTKAKTLSRQKNKEKAWVYRKA